MFSKVLIANRGEIACRVLRTCRRLGVRTVAIYSDADEGAMHAALADEAVRVGPAPVKESYLQIDAVVAAAKQTGAEAVHPGYGLLSERSAFARAVADAGIVFIGPPPDVLDALGDKMKARHVAKAAGVASVPGLDEPLPLDDSGALALAREHGERIGYPIIIKAVGGGGGIGMQIVPSADKLERAMKTCSDRARSAFGDARVYLERYLSSPKHIEVQGLCDGRGGAISLGERECSVQRRHQKIVEESPSPAPFFREAAGQRPAQRRRRSGAQGFSPRRLRRRGHLRVHRGRRRASLFPRGERASAGRAPGDGDVHRRRSGRRATAHRVRRRVVARAGSRFTRASRSLHRGAPLRRRSGQVLRAAARQARQAGLAGGGSRFAGGDGLSRGRYGDALLRSAPRQDRGARARAATTPSSGSIARSR